MICWLSGHRPQYRSCTANRTVWYLARNQSSVFGGREHKNFGRGTLTHPRPNEFGMRQRSGEYFAPNPMLSFFGMDFALKFGGEDQKNKKRSSSQNLRLLDYVHLICLAV